MRKSLAKRLEAEQQRHEAVLAAMADERIADFAREWKRTRKGPIKLIFGMGTMAAEGKNGDDFGRYCGPNGWPKILEDLDRDLDDITNQYRAACPNDDLEIN